MERVRRGYVGPARLCLGAELRLRIERSGISFARIAALADCNARHLYQNFLEPDELLRLKNVVELIERGDIPTTAPRTGLRSDLRGRESVPA